MTQSVEEAVGAVDAAQLAGASWNPTSEKGKATVQAVSVDEAHRHAALAIRQSVAFAQIVSLLMRVPLYKHHTLTDLEWLVLPPLRLGQFRIAEIGTNQAGLRLPVAVALWASVSADVDNRLTESISAAVQLRPDEWRSGDILWLVDAIGDARVLGPLLAKLRDSVWKGREVKMRAIEGGQPYVKRLSDAKTT